MPAAGPVPSGAAAGSARNGLGGSAFAGDPVPATAEHGRGLKIIHAVADNMQLTGNERRGTTVHFEKTLQWLPGAAGQHPGLSGGSAGVVRVAGAPVRV